MHELPAELLLDPADRGGRRGGAPHHHPRAPVAGHRLAALAQRTGGGQRRLQHAGGAGGEGDALVLHPAQDLGAVHAPQHHLAPAHRGEAVGDPPAVAVEEGQRLQVHVADAHAQVPADAGGVEPQGAVGELDALRPGGGAGGVVDRGGRVLVGLPGRRRLVGAAHQGGVLLAVEHDPVWGAHVREGLVELGVDQEHLGAGVLGDVGHVAGVQAEVDGHQHPPEGRDAEERDHEARRVGAHDGHPRAVVHAQAVELPGHPARPSHEVGGGHPAQRRGSPGLVHHQGPVAEELRPVEEVDQGQGDPHAGQRSALRPARPDPRPAR